MALTKEQQDYFDAYDEMFATEGWKLLITDAENQIRALGEEALARPDEASSFAGEARTLRYLVNLEVSLDNTKRMMLEDINDASV